MGVWRSQKDSGSGRTWLSHKYNKSPRTSTEACRSVTRMRFCLLNVKGGHSVSKEDCDILETKSRAA